MIHASLSSSEDIVMRNFFVGVVVALILMVGFKAYRSYQHFEWQNIRLNDKGDIAAVPSWRK